MLIRKRHPLTGALYQQDERGVRVELDDKYGLFTMRGEWIEGDLHQADPLMCLWIGSGEGRGGSMQLLFSVGGDER